MNTKFQQLLDLITKSSLANASDAVIAASYSSYLQSRSQLFIELQDAMSAIASRDSDVASSSLQDTFLVARESITSIYPEYASLMQCFFSLGGFISYKDILASVLTVTQAGGSFAEEEAYSTLILPVYDAGSLISYTSLNAITNAMRDALDDINSTIALLDAAANDDFTASGVVANYNARTGGEASNSPALQRGLQVLKSSKGAGNRVRLILSSLNLSFNKASEGSYLSVDTSFGEYTGASAWRCFTESAAETAEEFASTVTNVAKNLWGALSNGLKNIATSIIGSKAGKTVQAVLNNEYVTIAEDFDYETLDVPTRAVVFNRPSQGSSHWDDTGITMQQAFDDVLDNPVLYDLGFAVIAYGRTAANQAKFQIYYRPCKASGLEFDNGDYSQIGGSGNAYLSKAKLPSGYANPTMTAGDVLLTALSSTVEYPAYDVKDLNSIFHGIATARILTTCWLTVMSYAYLYIIEPEWIDEILFSTPLKNLSYNSVTKYAFGLNLDVLTGTVGWQDKYDLIYAFLCNGVSKAATDTISRYMNAKSRVDLTTDGTDVAPLIQSLYSGDATYAYWGYDPSTLRDGKLTSGTLVDALWGGSTPDRLTMQDSGYSYDEVMGIVLLFAIRFSKFDGQKVFNVETSGGTVPYVPYTTLYGDFISKYTIVSDSARAAVALGLTVIVAVAVAAIAISVGTGIAAIKIKRKVAMDRQFNQSIIQHQLNNVVSKFGTDEEVSYEDVNNCLQNWYKVNKRTARVENLFTKLGILTGNSAAAAVSNGAGYTLTDMADASNSILSGATGAVISSGDLGAGVHMSNASIDAVLRAITG